MVSLVLWRSVEPSVTAPYAGNALGDAYGLATEFIDADTIRRMYPNTSQPIPFPNYKLTGHNARWQRGDWYMTAAV